MKVHVLFDDMGNVGAMFHPRSGMPPSGGFLPHDKQTVATLDVPPELEHLKPRELHDSVRVEVKGGSPRLVAKPK